MRMKVVKFSNLDDWSAKSYFNTISSNFKLVKLRKYIQQNTNKIKPFLTPNQNFDILGVNNKIGVYFNETLKGSRIKQPYFQVNSGEIFYNPYRVNVGSIGIVPKEFHNKFTSSAYIVFKTFEKELLAEFLLLVMKSEKFNEYLRANTKGSVRQNLSFEALCELQIPLPPLEIQNKIVDDIKAIDEQIANLEKRKKQLKDDIELYIYSSWTKFKPKFRKTKGIYDKFQRFKSLGRGGKSKLKSIHRHVKRQISTCEARRYL